MGRQALACFLLLASARAAAAAEPPARFDLDAARDAGTLDARELPGSSRAAGGVRLREITFTSTEWTARGAASPIRIHAYLAVPEAGGRRPAVLHAHGMGSEGHPDAAAELARRLGVVALSLDAPGAGRSEGRGVSPDDARPLFDAFPDVRGSWLYAYGFAMLRAVTYLGTLPEVDAGVVVVHGVSMGGVASFLVGATDDRVRGIVPAQASGGLAATIAAGGWLGGTLRSARLRPRDPGPRAVLGRLDPLRFRRQHGTVAMVIGAQDEFFPLDQAVRTFEALEAPRKTLAVIADYDHGWYFASGCTARCMTAGGPGCPACPPCRRGARPPYCGPHGSYNRHEDYTERTLALIGALVRSAPPPGTPALERRGDVIVVRPAPGPPPVAVRLAMSDNRGYTYGQVTLERADDGTYRLARKLPARAILIAEVEGAGGAVATSIPRLPRGFRPHIRPYQPVP